MRARALRLLTRREHGRAELAVKLRGRGYSAREVDTVLSKLEADGLLCDERFVGGFVRERMERGYGPLKVQRELRSRGIEQRLIREFLRAGDEAWFSRVREVRLKRFGEILPSAEQDRVRQARFLESRGFTEEQIHRALSK